MFNYLLANLLPSCCAGLNFLNCGVIDIMILLKRAIKSNSFWILSAEENFVIKEESDWCFSFVPELVGYSAPRDLHRRAAYSICESLFLIHQDVYHDLFVCS